MKLILPARTPPQKRISESDKRFKVAVWGRQSGKTTYGTWTMAQRPLTGPRNGVYWYILQTHNAAEIAFNRYVNLFPRDSWAHVWAKRPNESEKTVFLTGGRNVFFKSGENFEDLRSETLHGAVIDECRQQRHELWSQIIRPMLGRHKGWCDFLSTPNGYDWFYDLYTAANNEPNEWATFHAPSTEAWWWSAEEIASAKKTMSEAEYAQEILAEFRDLTAGRAYANFGAHNKLVQNPFVEFGKEYSPYLPIHVALDFNISPMSWSLAQKKAEHMHFTDEINLMNSNTQEASRLLIEKVKDHKMGLVLCGDATGNARQRAAAGKSDYDILCAMLDDARIKWMNLTPESNPGVKDRVNTVNARLKSASGEVHITVNPEKCPKLVKDFERVTWKENSSSMILDQTKDKSLTHPSDGAGYLICQTLPILSASSKPGVLSVIIR